MRFDEGRQLWRFGGVLERKGLFTAVGVLVLSATLLLLSTEPAAAQQTANPAATSPQMRHFWHVFTAYAIAWVLLFGWLVSIGRRLGRVEEKLDA